MLKIDLTKALDVIDTSNVYVLYDDRTARRVTSKYELITFHKYGLPFYTNDKDISVTNFIKYR